MCDADTSVQSGNGQCERSVVQQGDTCSETDRLDHSAATQDANKAIIPDLVLNPEHARTSKIHLTIDSNNEVPIVTIKREIKYAVPLSRFFTKANDHTLGIAL
jgi:hypothetical protein